MPPSGVDTSVPPVARRELSEAVTSFVHLWDAPDKADAPSHLPIYGAGSGVCAEKLTSACAALPAPGEAATADLIDLLPLEDRALLLEGNCLAAFEPSPEALRKLPVFCNVVGGDYVPLLHRMKASGMLHLFKSGQGVLENGIFGLSKTVEADSPQRVIWDGRRSNLYFNQDLATVVLPSPDMLGEVFLPSPQRLFASTSDVSQMYNRLLAPQWLWRYFGLPRVWAPSFDPTLKEDYYHPALKVIPMGWSLAVRFAQAVHLEILRRAGVPAGTLLLRGSYLSSPLSCDAAVTFLPYIDDLAVLGTSVNVVNTSHQSIKEHLIASGLPVHPGKNYPASFSRSTTTCLGLAVHHDGLVSPQPHHLLALLDTTYALLQTRRATPREMQRLLGRWVWPLLLRRPLLSVLSELYSPASLPRPHVPRLLNLPQLTELHALIGIAPMVFRDLTRPVSPRLYATDASPWGGGVVYSDEDGRGSSPTQQHALVSFFRDARVLSGWYAFPDITFDPGPPADEDGSTPEDDINSTTSAASDDFTYPLHSDKYDKYFARLSEAWTEDLSLLPKWSSLHWKTAIIHRWRASTRSYHINVLEIEALILAVRHMSRSPATRGTRVLVFLDSLVGLGSLAKGRSASRRLNRACRKLAAYAVLFNVELLLHWVPTEHQPADAASRRSAPRNSSRRPDRNRS